MTPDQIQTCITLVKGYWPAPEMFEEELVVWSAHLFECADPDLAQRIVTELAETCEYRPNAARFGALYRARAPRALAYRVVATAPELTETAERLTTEEWKRRCREQLANSAGPLFSKMRQRAHEVIKGAT
jgi:hypothetical protein